MKSIPNPKTTVQFYPKGFGDMARSTLRLAVCLAAIQVVPPARAELLVYEPFDYPDGPLTGQGGALGTTGTWLSSDTGEAKGWWVHPKGQLTGIGVNPGYDPLNPGAPGILNSFDGIVDNLPTKGGFVGMVGPEDRTTPLPYGSDAGTGNLDASIGLAPSVTATFQTGTTTWFSYVGAHSWDRNQGSPIFTLGTDPTTIGSRGLNLQNSGNGIGATGGPPRFNLFEVYPQFYRAGVKNESPGGYKGGVLGDGDGQVTVFASTTTSDGVLPANFKMSWEQANTFHPTFGAPNIIIGKIEWDADTGGYDIITAVRFLESDTISEAAFDALVAAQPALSSKNWPAAVTPADPLNPSNKPNLDQSQFDTLNIASLKFFVDELRIGTTFQDVVTAFASATFPLTITPAAFPATGYDLAWASQAGKRYNLRTSTGLDTPIRTWDLVVGNIIPTPPTNTYNVPQNGPRRFYAAEEYAAPPVTIVNEGFETGLGAFTIVNKSTGTDWAQGAPDSTGFGGTVNTGNGGSAKCVGTKLGDSTIPDPGFYVASTDTSLRSGSIDLTGVTEGTLSFAEALDVASGDTAVVNIIEETTDTVIASAIRTSTPDTSSSSAAWSAVGPINLPAAAFGKKVRIEWRFTGSGGTSLDYMGWYIDDVMVTVPGS